MARIKYVLNERRLAYEGAVEIHQDNAQAIEAEKEVTRRGRIAAAARAKELHEQKEKELAKEHIEPVDGAAQLAVSGLLQQEAAPNVQQS